ncbi:SDR family oxidoreductase, partial [Verrucomicrobiales bacterium]|nr:SDR family oxidoreductase [Verrucomicrobiales bacterium]
GWIDTPGERDSFTEETIVAEGKKLPWGRLGTIDDIGNTAAFLASDASDYITGVALAVDGGYLIKGGREIPTDE